jgi:lipid-A-disaccharide synthase
MFIRAKRMLMTGMEDRKPALAVLVDFPDFNLKLARSLKKNGIIVVYYISPQLWAWRQYRVKAIKKYVDLLITILPFEKEWYAKRGVTKVEYVGNPLAREVYPSSSREGFFGRHKLDLSLPMVALLPGSRPKEISRILPNMLRTAGSMPQVQFVIAVNRDIGGQYQFPSNVICVRNETYNTLAAADAAAVTSGTATLETGILGTPMVIVYKTSRINFAVLEPMIDVPHYGLINLIAGKCVAAELIQNDLTEGRLKSEIERLLEPVTNKRTRLELNGVAAKLGKGGASKRAADAILNLIHS